jgi:AmiR/NasT family two-component response regulator
MKSLVIAAPGELQNTIDAALSAAGAGEAKQARTIASAQESLEGAGFVLLVSGRCTDEQMLFLKKLGERGIASALLTTRAEAPRAEQQLLTARCLVLCAPLSSKELAMGIRMALSISRKFAALQKQNEQLRQRLEDFKILDRAKCCLVAVLGMDEERAHRYIQKRAMDMRLSQREIAEDILKTYETHEAYLSEF